MSAAVVVEVVLAGLTIALAVVGLGGWPRPRP